MFLFTANLESVAEEADPQEAHDLCIAKLFTLTTGNPKIAWTLCLAVGKIDNFFFKPEIQRLLGNPWSFGQNLSFPGRS